MSLPDTHDFHLKADDIKLEDNHILTTTFTVTDENGDPMPKVATLDLDEYVGNHGGSLVWGAKFFGATARDIQLVMGPDSRPWLLAHLYGENNRPTRRTALNLAEHIGVAGGEFVVDLPQGWDAESEWDPTLEELRKERERRREVDRRISELPEETLADYDKVMQIQRRYEREYDAAH